VSKTEHETPPQFTPEAPLMESAPAFMQKASISLAEHGSIKYMHNYNFDTQEDI
jgi:hypothetical protein